MPTRLFTETAFFDAVRKILMKVREEAARRELKSLKAYLVGGVAIHVWTGLRSSRDVDVMYNTPRPLDFPSDLEDLAVEFVDADGKRNTVFYDTRFTETLSLVHYDCDRRAHPLLDDTIMPVYVLDPIDLALMKMSRFIARDQEDIRTLVRLGLLDDPVRIEALTREALPDYVGNEQRLLETLEIVKRWMYDESQRKKHTDPHVPPHHC
jgi:hypothetical protein